MIRRPFSNEPCAPCARFVSSHATLLVLVLLLPLLTSAQSDIRDRRTTTNSVAQPTVTLTPETTTITVCPEDATRAQSEVRLRAQTTGFSSANTARYTWTVSGGQIRDEGRTATWDLSGVAPGAYTATLEVDDGTSDSSCRAFTSAIVVARECPPVRVQCPTISLNCPDSFAAGVPSTLTVNISGVRADISPTFNWNITRGTIINGQGTEAITVDFSSTEGNSFIARVEVGGFDTKCPATASCSVITHPPLPTPEPRKFDEFPSVSFDDDKARLDNLAVELQNDPTARGFIIVHPGNRGRADQASRLGERARRYLTNVRGIDASRLTIVSGAPRERLTYELYIVPLGATPPAVGQ